MSDAHKGKEYHRWRKAVMAAAKAGNIPTVCYRCGQPIDMDLPSSHPEGPSVEHTHPISQGGDIYADLDSAALSHLNCNRKHGGKLGARHTNTPPHARRARAAAPPPNFSRGS